MAETNYPLLILPASEDVGERSKGMAVPPKVHFPGMGRQQARLGDKLAALDKQLRDRTLQLQVSSMGAEPEEVIVLEIVGSADDFAKAVQRIEGLEWLGELIEEDLDPDEDFYEEGKKGPKLDKLLTGRLFMVFSNKKALGEILRLWKVWQDGKELPYGYAKWRDVFMRLKDVRVWGVQDRVEETGVLDAWRNSLELGDEVRCEIEVWHRQDPDRMRAALKRIESFVCELEGEVRSRCSLGEIRYHAMVVRLPRASVERIVADPKVAHEVKLLISDDVQFVRPVGQFAAPTGDLEGNDVELPDYGKVEQEPVSALLDGLPLQNHHALGKHLIVDDCDGFEEDYPAQKRCHGTAMASVMINGDLSSPQPVGRRIYVRPIMRAHSFVNVEVPPEDALIVDLVHRAVRRIKEGENGAEPVAPHVCIVNLSIGDRGRPFYNAMSPLARLLDWLAWRYGVLFLISAGNHVEPIQVDIGRTEFLSLDGLQQANELLRAVSNLQHLRRIYSPAESMNGLCVGASNNDASDAGELIAHIDPYGASPLPSPISAVGLGYKRSIKPDLIANGGRCPVEVNEGEDGKTLLSPYRGTLAPGVSVASPSLRPGGLGNTIYTRGSSIACAFASHWGTRLYDMLSELRQEHAEAIDLIPRALWIKALLVHSSVWAEPYDALAGALRDESNSRKFREVGARFLGYGHLEGLRGFECAENRATALGAGEISVDEKRRHRFPLPPSLGSKREWKRLTVTLAWFTPINAAHQAWRRAHLWFDADVDPLKIDRNGAEHRAMRRGTVHHEIYDGNKAAVFLDGDAIAIDVNCRADAGALEAQVPYALAVTLEVGDGVKIPIYEEVKTRLRIKVPVGASI